MLKKLFLSTAIILSAFSSSKISAMNIDMHSTLITKAALSVFVSDDFNFGDVFFNPTHKGKILLGTNGKVQTSADTQGLSVSGLTNAAVVEVGGLKDEVIEISCGTDAALATKNAETILLTDTEFMINEEGDFGAGNSCAGLGQNPVIFDLSKNPVPKIYMGAALNISENSVNTTEVYDSKNAGGRPVPLRIVYK